MIEDFVKVLLAKVREDINNYSTDISTGGCRSYDDYKHLCGVILGLARAESYIQDLAKKVIESDE